MKTEICDDCFEHLYVVQNQLNLNNSTDMLVGRISSFLQKHIGVSEVNPKAFYEVLFAEVTRRNDYKGSCKSKKEMLEHKAVSKSQFADYIQGIRNFKSFESKCQSVLSELNEGTTFSERRKIKYELNNSIKKEYFQYDNVEFRKLTNTIMSIKDSISDDDCENLWKFGNKILKSLKQTYSNPLGYSDNFLLSLIFYLV